MAMTHCKECGAEISKSAKTCPNCGKKLKHSGLRIIIGILIIIIGIGCIAGSTNNNSNTSSTSSSVVTKENYDKIQKGMTKEEVKEILGEPSSVSESETPGVGIMELNHFQEDFSLQAIDIYFLDGVVYMKNWTDL